MKSRVDAACVVASCVRADSSVAIRIWNGSSACASEIFSTAGSSSPVIARASDRMTRSTTASAGFFVVRFVMAPA